jgi:poly-gamma-glutamate capsule biosynthesis protein CapA/YwtB (metallophosphatase superfamily)
MEAIGPLVIRLFLCGDVMTGRGIDQILPHPSDPTLHEDYVKNAREYVQLAEEANGPIPKPVSFSYVWGDALEILHTEEPDLRIINLETSVTKSNDYWKGKGINYRMNPENITCLTAAKVDCCSMANNHVLDWGYSGLVETLGTLQKSGIKNCGAGEDKKQAANRAILQCEGKGRVLIFSFGSPSSGVPLAWAASDDRSGVNWIDEADVGTIRTIKENVFKAKRRGDIVVASIHWGSNWGYEIPNEQREFAHRLIDEAQVDVIHGHSSHHAKGIEVYNGKLILYGCGDFLNDYEGIMDGFEEFRGDLSLMYFANVQPTTGRLVSLSMVSTQLKRFRINRASKQDTKWLGNVLYREGNKLRTSVNVESKDILSLSWN